VPETSLYTAETRLVTFCLSASLLKFTNTTNPDYFHFQYLLAIISTMAPRTETLSDEEPPAIEPYTVLGISKNATAEEVKTAYRKAALKNHPGNFLPYQILILQLRY
jgi:hypothetical protein